MRRMLRYRNLVVRQAVRMKNKMSGLLMEVGAQYNKQQLHGKRRRSDGADLDSGGRRPHRLTSVARAVSYCGLTSALVSSRSPEK